MRQDAISLASVLFKERRGSHSTPSYYLHTGGSSREGESPAADSIHLGGKGLNPGSVTSCLYDLGGPISSLSLSFLAEKRSSGQDKMRDSPSW